MTVDEIKTKRIELDNKYGEIVRKHDERVRKELAPVEEDYQQLYKECEVITNTEHLFNYDDETGLYTCELCRYQP